MRKAELIEFPNFVKQVHLTIFVMSTYYHTFYTISHAPRRSMCNPCEGLPRLFQSWAKPRELHPDTGPPLPAGMALDPTRSFLMVVYIEMGRSSRGRRRNRWMRKFNTRNTQSDVIRKQGSAWHCSWEKWRLQSSTWCKIIDQSSGYRRVWSLWSYNELWAGLSEAKKPWKQIWGEAPV